MQKEHYYWIDNIKIFACLMVLLGHFFQSMIKSSILPEGILYQWFNQTIYYFHVPLFFLCSGFLYQKFSKIDSINAWYKNLFRKVVGLGVPYFAFSIITWILKTIFSETTNSGVGGLVDSLFLNPISPYWFLYCLFLIFVITPTFKNKKVVIIGLIVSVIMKIISIIIGFNVYAVSIVLTNEIWFVIGMALVFVPLNKINKNVGIIMIALFFIMSGVFIKNNNAWIAFIMTIVAILGFVIIFKDFNKTTKILKFFAKYTMPIFLMHTLFAATLRIILIKIGITFWVPQVILGIAISIAGPIIAAMVMEKIGWLNFFLYPWTVLNKKHE